MHLINQKVLQILVDCYSELFVNFISPPLPHHLIGLAFENFYRPI